MKLLLIQDNTTDDCFLKSSRQDQSIICLANAQQCQLRGNGTVPICRHTRGRRATDRTDQNVDSTTSWRIYNGNHRKHYAWYTRVSVIMVPIREYGPNTMIKIT